MTRIDARTRQMNNGKLYNINDRLVVTSAPPQETEAHVYTLGKTLMFKSDALDLMFTIKDVFVASSTQISKAGVSNDWIANTFRDYHPRLPCKIGTKDPKTRLTSPSMPPDI